MKGSKDLAKQAQPEKFKASMAWNNWKPTFVNFLRMIPGRDGVPLSYVVRDTDAPDPTPHPDFIEEYVRNAPVTGEAFVIDSHEVCTYLMQYITGNSDAEAKVQSLQDETDGRKAFKALEALYKGSGMNAVDIAKADIVIESLVYTGEKKPHMWWEEFEKQLRLAFATHDKKENRVVYSDIMKLRILMKKIKADFLEASKGSLNIELNKPVITLTFEGALTVLRNAVRDKYPPSVTATGSQNRRFRSINATGRYGRGDGRYGGRYGRGRSRGGGRYGRSGRNDGRSRGGRGRDGGRWMQRTLPNGLFI